MLFLVYNQRDDKGSGLIVELHDTREDLIKQLNRLEHQRADKDIKYEILLVAEGTELIMEQRKTWRFC